MKGNNDREFPSLPSLELNYFKGEGAARGVIRSLDQHDKGVH